MDAKRIDNLLTDLIDARTPAEAGQAMRNLVLLRAEIRNELPAQQKPVELPEGYVEFAMAVMKRAKTIEHHEIASVGYMDVISGKAVWVTGDWADAGAPENQIDVLIKIGALALRMAVESPTIEGTVNA